MIVSASECFSGLPIRGKLDLIEREKAAKMTNQELARKYGLGASRQLVTYFRRLNRLRNWPEGEALLDAIDEKRISFEKVHVAINGAIDDVEFRKNVDALLEWAAANAAAGEEIGRGRNPLPERDRRSRRHRL